MKTYHIRLAFLLGVFFSGLSSSLVAQSVADRAAIGGHVGVNQYYGTFADGSLGFGGDLFLRWNVLPELSLYGQLGGMSLRYGVDAEAVAAYPEYFGEPDAEFYPNTANTVRRDPTNIVGLTTYALFGSYNFRPSDRLVPYAFLGVGVVTFNPRNGDQGNKLPNNLQSDIYKNTQVMFPFGAGAEWYWTPDLTLNAKVQFHLTTTDYLDDFEDGGSADAFASLSFGASYYLFGTLDCDKDGMDDREEERVGTDPCKLDTDDDGLADRDEIRRYGTDPLDQDTDADGLSDSDEVLRIHTNPLVADSDGDNLSDGDEVNIHKTDPLKVDTDVDGLSDGDEVLEHRTNPLDVDTDKDGLTDGSEVNTHKTSPLQLDTDTDRLGDGDEVNGYKTNPLLPDTDGDGLVDSDEIETWKTNPLKQDTDDDLLSDAAEIRNTKTDPNDPDSDDDTVIDGKDACPLVRGVVERNGCPAPPKVGTITDFPAVYFIVNTDEFDFAQPQTNESLAKIMSYVNQCPGLRVLIEGHASREGSTERNRTLSEMRADRVKLWLVERGIAPEKIEGTIGYGSLQNAVPEPDPTSEEARRMDPDALEAIRKQNRRIAVRVVRTCD